MNEGISKQIQCVWPPRSSVRSSWGGYKGINIISREVGRGRKERREERREERMRRKTEKMLKGNAKVILN